MSERSYEQYCGIARALDLVGGRWGLLVVRELILGPKRFTDLSRGLPGIGTNVLSARLKQLERGGVIHRRALPPPAASTVYELTEYGRGLEEILLALGRWGASTMGPRRPGQALRSEWLVVALRAFFRPEAAAGVRETFELRLSDGVFQARVEDGRLELAQGAAPGAALVLETDEETLVGLLAGAVEPDRAEAAGLLSVEGRREELGRLLELFAFGEPVAAEASGR